MGRNPTILGMDLGTTAGWALLDLEGRRLASGVIDCSFDRWEGASLRGLKFEAGLRTLLAEHAPGAAVYELVRRHKGAEAAHVYGDLQGILLRVTAQAGLPLAKVSVGTVKKHATGKGNASKAAMVKAARARWGHDPKSDDEADALWMASAWLEAEGRELLTPMREAS